MKRRLKVAQLCSELEEVASRMFAEVRRDQGLFRTGACILKGRNILVVNTRQSCEERIAALARAIAGTGVDSVFLKPALRAEIEHYAPESNPCTQ